MRSQRESTADQQGNHLNAAVKIAKSCRRQNRSRGNADESVNDVPDAINQLNLVGNKFNYKQEQRNADHPPIREHFQLPGKLQVSKPAEQTQSCDGGVKVDA